MTFHSADFGVFFVVVFLVFWLIHRWRAPRVLFLLAASYLFYIGLRNLEQLWGLLRASNYEPWAFLQSIVTVGEDGHWHCAAPGACCALLIIFQTVSDYFVALLLVRIEREGTRKALLWVSIVVNLGILA